jgi:gliding motility-associated-like protein
MRLSTGVFFSFFLFALSASAQVTISRQVISPFALSGGEGVKINSTAGQPEYKTGDSENTILTQGFQQPEQIDPLQVDYQVAFPQCSNGSDGNIQITSISGCATDEYEIFWNGEPGDLILSGVSPGSYALEVTGPGFCSFSAVIQISEMDITQDCELSFYNTLFPNGATNNQTWIIENITLPEYEQNTVKIINRWGQTVWEAENYDNETVVFRGIGNNGSELPDGTYFYLVEAGGLTFDGYIELLR